MIQEVYIYNSCLGSITSALYVNHPGQSLSCINKINFVGNVSRETLRVQRGQRARNSTSAPNERDFLVPTRSNERDNL